MRESGDVLKRALNFYMVGRNGSGQLKMTRKMQVKEQIDFKKQCCQ